MRPFDIVDEFERRVAAYAGSEYGVAVHSCTDALLLSFWLRRIQGWPREIILPSQTYVGVAYSALNAGLKIMFSPFLWQGIYAVTPIDVVDGARRFYKGMYHGGLHCLSFHWYKHLPIGRGGMILTDSGEEEVALKAMRYDGRTQGVAPRGDNFTLPGFHCYMAGDDAWQGIRLLENIPDFNEDIPWDEYPDLSKYPIFTEGYDEYFS
jgi:dTDP-4-amino-4,6-dideoxygalactose transaminase